VADGDEGAVGASEEARRPDFFDDLNLDQVVDAVTTGYDQYGLDPFFCRPLQAVADVAYRQEVPRDLEDATLFARISAFAEAMRSMRSQSRLTAKTRNAHQSQRWFVRAATIYVETVSTLAGDLELTTLLGAMANEDPFLYDVARRALLTSLDDPDAIRYRQDVLRDFLDRPELLVDLYAVAAEAVVQERRYVLSRLFDAPENTLHRATLDLKAYVVLLKRLRLIADAHSEDVASEGLSRFVRMLGTELGDAFFEEVAAHLRRLDLGNDARMSAALGSDLTSTDHLLHEPALDRRRWYERFTTKPSRSFTCTVPYQDERGLTALGELRGRGVGLVADALAQSTDHILAFFHVLRSELGFFRASLNLHDRLVAIGSPACFPLPDGTGLTLACRGLYDPCLALTTRRPVVGNDVEARGARLIVVTGANQGGKSTFLRSVGLAQLMAQAGMFAPADALALSPCSGLFTHFRRQEDATMTSGKLDEEFVRMSEIVDHLTPGALVLFNESFAATNEREGSHISREVVLALSESGVRAVYVTHLYDLAHGLHRDRLPGTVFLRAPRADDGTRSFRLVEGEPLPTSFGRDVYERVFGGAGERESPHK
jgi:hypothetical protein